MAELPLLLFPSATRITPPSRKGWGGPNIHRPEVARQKERLGPAFQRLEAAFEERRAELSISATGMEPEKVLVIETAGDIQEFQRAVRAISGLEWLGDFELDEFASDEFFIVEDNEEQTKKPTRKNIYLTMSDQRALSEILSLWNSWNELKQKFPRGKAKWREIFSHCSDIRYWGIKDRLDETGLIEQLRENILAKPDAQFFPLEIEFWHHSQVRMRVSRNRIVEQLREENGRLISSAVIGEIRYSAIKAEIPRKLVEQITHQAYPKFFEEDAISFLRPVGQCAVSIQGSATTGILPKNQPIPTKPPVVAILDGVPFERHQILADRIELDDPLGFASASAYENQNWKHGTAMASLVIHGELDDHNSQALTSTVIARPVMKPVPNLIGAGEEIPEDVLLVDFFHQAIKELLEQNPNIKIINISLGDKNRPFDRIPSPWARLLDWLSFKYQVLFCVSAGNFSGDMKMEISSAQFTALSDDEKSERTISAMSNELLDRRLLSPAESINAITVGALHRDLAGQYNPLSRIDMQPYDDLPSPITRLGMGFRNSIKPDILMPGGRQLYRSLQGQTIYRIFQDGQKPGQSVAAPVSASGQVDRTTYTQGTSNATALASRGAVQIHDVIREIQEKNPQYIPDENLAVVMKALLVHGASWGNAYGKLSVLKTSANSKKFRRYASRFMGYGAADIERVLECTERRVTLIATDSITSNLELKYRYPLPPSLIDSRVARRLVITLAWMTPINPAHRNWRRARLYYAPPKKTDFLKLSRQETDWQQVQKGTVQHEILKGKSASIYQDGDYLNIAVACRSDAGKLEGPVRFGLAVTLEVLEDVEINIYNEIRDRIPARTRIPVEQP